MIFIALVLSGNHDLRTSVAYEHSELVFHGGLIDTTLPAGRAHN